MLKKMFFLVAALTLLFAFLGCTEEEGPAEKLGKKIDNVVNTTKKESQGALEKFNDDANAAFQGVKRKVNATAQEIGDGIVEAKDSLINKVEDLTQ